MKALLILACSATKRPDAGGLPALERYDGPAYRVLRKALRERPGLDERLALWVLSAEYGMIFGWRPIPHYDRKMTQARALELREETTLLLRDVLLTRWDRVYIDLGAAYRLALPPGYPPGAEWAVGGIGYRLGQLKDWLWGLEL